jgi:hypothetical protein
MEYTPLLQHSIREECSMSLFEEYDPLKGKMFQILKPDGTLEPGAEPPLTDQEIKGA